MLRFTAYRNGSPADDLDLGGAYVFGQDEIPVRADLASSEGQISCMKRFPGACGLALLWDAGTPGHFMLPTTRLPDRGKPYNLNVELARAQIARMAQKREDWGLFDYPDAEEVNREYETARKLFVESLKADSDADAADLADQALARGITVGEKMALFHAGIFLDRRKLSAAARRTSFGCWVDLFSTAEGYQEALSDAFDFVSVPMPWKHTEPKERTYQYNQTDMWVNWASRSGVRKAIHAGPLVDFQPKCLPEWLYLWENDYESLRDMIYEHIHHVVRRYQRYVKVWNVVSGIHAHNTFNLTFEQLMELTRMSCLLVKKLAPRSQVMIEMIMPWGEYYARNQRTIPPLLYADMAAQSGIKFDAFGLQLCTGVPADGFYVRDLLQVSSLLDELVSLGKPIHISAAQAPSDVVPDGWDAWEGELNPARGGRWHSPWSQRLQAEWLQAVYRIAISKPYVESICWRDLADYEGHYIPHGGLCKNSMEPKLAFREHRNFKASLLSGTVANHARSGLRKAPAGEEDRTGNVRGDGK